MKSQSTTMKLLENSIAAALSAIEIYNKPDFKYRNEIFVILNVNSWELLLKAKILNDNNHDFTSLYIIGNNGKFKINRNGTPLTINLKSALNKIGLDEVVKQNLFTFIEIRDASMHFLNTKSIDYLIYSLGVACLKNYQRLTSNWFGRDLLEYNFYILPLGFAYHFKTFSLLELDKEPKILKMFLENISKNQELKSENGFFFTCNIQIHLTSAKKITEDTDLTVAVDPKEKNVIAVVNKRLIDRYPLSYSELWIKIKKEIPSLKQNIFNQFLKKNRIKENPEYSVLNFRYAKHEEDYRKTGKTATNTPSIYNHECLNFLLAELPKVSEAESSKNLPGM